MPDPAPMSRAAAIVYAIGLPVGLLVLVFGPVERLDWLPGWIFVATLVAGFGVSGLVIAVVNPVIFRARSRFQAGTQKWDLVLLAVMLPAMVAEIPLGTLDSGRMHWSVMPSWVVVFGHVLILLAIAGTAWAQAVNPFFEPGVRLQKEREQRVISNGPYRLVRHPGYTAAIMLFIGVALALASWWALVPAALASSLLVLRTSWEDRLLQSGLPGYTDYAQRVRFRLLPQVW
jgi:protein-S-isoprenylcysteine O-methyltransferase Ste14